MQPRDNPSLVLPLIGHLVMGAALGTFLALSLIASRTHGIFDMIANSAAPRLTTAVFVGVFTLMFAVGATLTGWIFLALEDG